MTLPLTLEADNSNHLLWWIGSTFINHVDMHSHTGGAIDVGQGVVCATSTCKKLNTWREAKLVVVHNCMDKFCGQDYSWKHRVIKLMMLLCTKITRAHCYWRIMAGVHVGNVCII